MAYGVKQVCLRHFLQTKSDMLQSWFQLEACSIC